MPTTKEINKQLTETIQSMYVSKYLIIACERCFVKSREIIIQFYVIIFQTSVQNLCLLYKKKTHKILQGTCNCMHCDK